MHWHSTIFLLLFDLFKSQITSKYTKHNLYRVSFNGNILWFVMGHATQNTEKKKVDTETNRFSFILQSFPSYSSSSSSSSFLFLFLLLFVLSDIYSLLFCSVCGLCVRMAVHFGVSSRFGSAVCWNKFSHVFPFAPNVIIYYYWKFASSNSQLIGNIETFLLSIRWIFLCSYMLQASEIRQYPIAMYAHCALHVIPSLLLCCCVHKQPYCLS